MCIPLQCPPGATTPRFAVPLPGVAGRHPRGCCPPVPECAAPAQRPRPEPVLRRFPVVSVAKTSKKEQGRARNMGVTANELDETRMVRHLSPSKTVTPAYSPSSSYLGMHQILSELIVLRLQLRHVHRGRDGPWDCIGPFPAHVPVSVPVVAETPTAAVPVSVPVSVPFHTFTFPLQVPSIATGAAPRPVVASRQRPRLSCRARRCAARNAVPIRVKHWHGFDRPSGPQCRRVPVVASTRTGTTTTTSFAPTAVSDTTTPRRHRHRAASR